MVIGFYVALSVHLFHLTKNSPSLESSVHELKVIEKFFSKI